MAGSAVLVVPLVWGAHAQHVEDQRTTSSGRPEPFTSKEGGPRERISPEEIVYPGDRLSLEQVDNANLPSLKMLDAIQVELIRLAVLRITRQDGTVVRVGTPMRFFQHHPSTQHISVSHIVSNIRSIINTTDNSELGRITRESEMIASTIQSRVAQLSQKDSLDLELNNVIGLSIMLGQYLAKAESATTIEPMAIIAERSQKKSREGGVKSGNARRNAPWRQVVKDVAVVKIKEDPSLSQDKLATEVAALWKERNIEPPTHKTIKNFISELEQTGKLPKRRMKS
jgi:hypothetical protein